MNQNKELFDKLMSIAGLPMVSSVSHLGFGELNNSYLVVTSDGAEYCIRIAKYPGKEGLQREADALSRLSEGIGPRLIYSPDDTHPLDTCWIIESYLPGQNPPRLNIQQFYSLGSKLARVHSVLAPLHDIVSPGEVTGIKNDPWPYLVWCCRSFYTENQLLHDLPDKRLLRLCRTARGWFDARRAVAQRQQTKHLLHKDLTPSNLLVHGNEAFLIDWELRDYGDPMIDFATGFWDDVEFNQGKWRIILHPDERTSLYQGYRDGGGNIDEERIKLWTTWDKFGASVFLCHRIHQPPDDQSAEQKRQYATDLQNIATSLENELLERS